MTEKDITKVKDACNIVLLSKGASVSDTRFYNDVLRLIYDNIDLKKEIDRLKAEQPKHGHWIEQEGFDGDVYYDCSVCGESWVTVEGTPEDNGMIYCPHCGAKMDETKAGEQE